MCVVIVAATAAGVVIGFNGIHVFKNLHQRCLNKQCKSMLPWGEKMSEINSSSALIFMPLCE